jgi:hypothetical protein
MSDVVGLLFRVGKRVNIDGIYVTKRSSAANGGIVHKRDQRHMPRSLSSSSRAFEIA